MPKIKSFFILFVSFLYFIPAISCFAAKAAPQAPINVPVPPAAINFPPVSQMMGAMLMFGFRGQELKQDDEFLQFIKSGQIGNVILFDKDVTSGGVRNIASPDQLKTLTRTIKESAPLPIFIAVDQEGGQVRRLKPRNGFMDLPSAQSMGQSSVHSTLELADKLGQELISLGINLDLAPVVDVAVNPYNPLIGKLGRAFSTDASIVSQHAYAFGQGLAKNGVVPTLKHFPGQGCAEKDTHVEPVSVASCWNADVDLLPYAEIFKAGWPGMVMLGHISHSNLDPQLPASLSWNIATGLLRNGLDWEGVVLSDDLQMKAIASNRSLEETIQLAVEAGVDILLFGNNLEWDPDLPAKVCAAFSKLFEDGKITEERIRQSWQRIAALHEAYGETVQQKTVE